MYYKKRLELLMTLYIDFIYVEGLLNFAENTFTWHMQFSDFLIFKLVRGRHGLSKEGLLFGH